MIQCSAHGITNRTDFSVRMIMPVCRFSRSRGTRMCTPFDIWTWNGKSTPVILIMSSVHTPVALITVRARMVCVRPVSRSSTRAPTTLSPSRSSPITLVRVSTVAPCSAAVLAIIIVWRASSTCAS